MRERKNTPGLRPNERAFDTDEGRTVAVRVARAPVPEGVEAVAFKTFARVVDAATGATVNAGGRPAEVCIGVRTVMSGALAKGERSMSEEIEKETQRAAERGARLAAELEAWSLLPEPEERL